MLPEQICYQDRYVTRANMLPEQICYQTKYVARTNKLPGQICCQDKYVTRTNMLPGQIFRDKCQCDLFPPSVQVRPTNLSLMFRIYLSVQVGVCLSDPFLYILGGLINRKDVIQCLYLIKKCFLLFWVNY